MGLVHKIELQRYAYPSQGGGTGSNPVGAAQCLTWSTFASGKSAVAVTRSKRRTSLLNSDPTAITMAIVPAIYNVVLVPIHCAIGPARNNPNGAKRVDPSAS